METELKVLIKTNKKFSKKRLVYLLNRIIDAGMEDAYNTPDDYFDDDVGDVKELEIQVMK